MGLMDGIKLAVHQHETNDPDQVEILYSSASMAVEGKNDIMTFISVLDNFMLRLDAADMKVADRKAQRVLLNGIDQDIFESFITEAERNPYATYQLLVKALTTLSAKARILSKLAALKPGRAQIATTVTSAETSSSEESRHDSRLASIERVLV